MSDVVVTEADKEAAHGGVHPLMAECHMPHICLWVARAIAQARVAGEEKEREACEKVARDMMLQDDDLDWQEACEAVREGIAARNRGG